MGTVGFDGGIALQNPRDDPDDPMASIDLPMCVTVLTESQPSISQQESDDRHPDARTAPKPQRHPDRQQPVTQQRVVRQPPIAQQNVRQDHQEVGDVAADNDGVATQQAPDSGERRPLQLHAVRRGVGRLQDRTKGKGSYVKALSNFHDQWSQSQRQLQEEMVTRHETFMRMELEASRQWESQQQLLHEDHTKQLIESSNAALTTAIDKLMGVFKKPPEHLQTFQPIAYTAGFPQPVHQFTYPVNVPSPSPSPNSMYNTTFPDNCNPSLRATNSPSSASTYSHHGSRTSSPAAISILSPSPSSSCNSSLPFQGKSSTSLNIIPKFTSSTDVTSREASAPDNFLNESS